MKRFLAIFLALSLAVGMLPLSAFAQTGEETDKAQAVLENGDMEISGFGGFGGLLAQELTAAQTEETAAEEDFPAGYTVTDLTFDGAQATVTYDTLEEAVLVVAVYTEDGVQLLNTGTAVADPETNQLTLTVEGEMPDYFYASAYLADQYDLSPLCAAYHTPLYTQEMQQLLASTTADYDESLVLNLDEDETTNFAVYNAAVVQAESADGVNELVSADEENAVYVIQNPDDTVKWLSAGSILALAYGENELLIVLADTVTLSEDETTLTITAGDVTMEQVFDCVKVEGEASMQEAQVDESSVGEGVTVLGMVAPEQAQTAALTDGQLAVNSAAKNAWSGDLSTEHSLALQLSTPKMADGVKLSLQVKLTVKPIVSYYVTWSYQYVSLRMPVQLDGGGEVAVELLDEVIFELPRFWFDPVPGVSIEVAPSFVCRAEAKMAVNFRWGFELGFAYESGTGGMNLCREPEYTIDLSVEGKFFAGLSVAPGISVLRGVIWLGLEYTAGLETIAAFSEDTGQTEENGPSKHLCTLCLEGKMHLRQQLTAKASFLKIKSLTVQYEFINKLRELGDFYISEEIGLGLGCCPNRLYKVVFAAKGKDGAAIQGQAISISGETENLVTNDKGVATVYLKPDRYLATLHYLGEQHQKLVKVKQQAQKVTFDLFWEDALNNILDLIEGEQVKLGPDTVIESGAWGDNATYTITYGGLLTINGTGALEYSSSYPWKDNYVTKAMIGEGITELPSHVLSGMPDLQTVTLPESLTTVFAYAMSDNPLLTNVNLPAALVNINGSNSYAGYVFDNCPLLLTAGPAGSGANIEFGWTEAVPASVFRGCKNIESVTLPQGIVTIGKNAFSDCDALGSITLPGTVTTLEDYAFAACDSLVEVKLNDGLKTIGKGALSGCTMTSLYIPDGVETIGNAAFSGCWFDGYITLPDSVTSMGESVFSGCSGMTDAKLPANLAEIPASTFSDCYNLASVVLPAAFTKIGNHAFSGCKKLTGMTLPATVTEIGMEVWSNVDYDEVSEEAYHFTSLTFLGPAPALHDAAFYGLIYCTVYYPGDASWEGVAGKGYGGTVIWAAGGAAAVSNAAVEAPVTEPTAEPTAAPTVEPTTTPTAEPTTAPTVEPTAAPAVQADALSTAPGGLVVGDSGKNQVYPGSHSVSTNGVYQASFAGLVPGEEYLMLVLLDLEAEQPLGADNLLYIAQAPAGADGTLAFTYIPRTGAEVCYVMASGASDQSLAQADIRLPFAAADNTEQVANPEVRYNGITLNEGVDYVVVGDVSATEAGVYTCWVRGIRRYTGLVQLNWVVAGPADVNGSGTVTIADGLALANHIAQKADLSDAGLTAAQLNGDEAVDVLDLMLLLQMLVTKTEV